MKDGEIARTTKELEDLLMANEKKQKSPMEELLAPPSGSSVFSHLP